jgi:hypothetical protein
MLSYFPEVFEVIQVLEQERDRQERAYQVTNVSFFHALRYEAITYGSQVTVTTDFAGIV